MLGRFDAIESLESLTKELGKDQLLRRDVFSAVELISLFVPFLGLLSGDVTTIKHIHVYDHKTKSSTNEAQAD
jgi:hypothetical protein